MDKEAAGKHLCAHPGCTVELPPHVTECPNHWTRESNRISRLLYGIRAGLSNEEKEALNERVNKTL